MLTVLFFALALAGEPGASLQLTSTDFRHNTTIPVTFTCQGEDRSPALAWTDLPAGTQSLVLIVDDPDAPDPAAPKVTWVHWVLYNLPPDATLAQSVKELPKGTLEGKNSWKRIGYGGPCPPIGTHRYFHKLYALDTVLPDLNKPDKDALLKAMEGHILAQTALIGLYKKS